MSVKTAAEQAIELRCPLAPRQLLAKVVRQGDYAAMTNDRTLMEVLCRDCLKATRRNDPSVRRVVHRFNVLGELVESIAQYD